MHLTDVEIHAAGYGWIVEVYGPAEDRETSTGHEVEMQVETAGNEHFIESVRQYCL